jgi:mRNA-degrading endonuclease YafQ of YafQ-DinJ toxin-antitoxin module
MFSEGKSPVEVVIALDLQAHYVEAKYKEYWECKRMFELVEIYEAKYDLHELLRLHRIIKRLGMEEQDIVKVL